MDASFRQDNPDVTTIVSVLFDTSSCEVRGAKVEKKILQLFICDRSLIYGKDGKLGVFDKELLRFLVGPIRWKGGLVAMTKEVKGTRALKKAVVYSLLSTWHHTSMGTEAWNIVQLCAITVSDRVTSWQSVSRNKMMKERKNKWTKKGKVYERHGE